MLERWVVRQRTCRHSDLLASSSRAGGLWSATSAEEVACLGCSTELPNLVPRMGWCRRHIECLSRPFAARSFAAVGNGGAGQRSARDSTAAVPRPDPALSSGRPQSREDCGHARGSRRHRALACGACAARFHHVANGTSTTRLIEAASIPGTLSIWADPLYEGPVPGGLTDAELLDVRAHLAGATDPTTYFAWAGSDASLDWTRSGDVASVPPHSLVAPDRPQGADAGRAETLWAQLGSRSTEGDEGKP